VTQRRRFLVSPLDLGVFLTPFIVSGSLLASGVARYRTTDDIQMILIASGVSSVAPSMDLVFTSELLAVLISWLYSLTTAVSWWPLLQLASLAAAIGTINVLILRREFSLRIRILTLLSINFLAIPLLVALNFTQPAILCAAVGLLLWLRGVRGRTRLAGLGLSAVGVLWRPEGALLGFVITIALLFVQVTVDRDGNRYRQVRRVIVGGLLASVVLLLIGLLPRWVRRSLDSSWSAYLDFNAVRYNFDGAGNFAYSEGALEVAARAGLSPNDVLLLVQGWFFQDREVYSKSIMEVVAAERSSIPAWNSIPRLLFEFMAQLLTYPIFLFLLSALIVLAPIVLMARRRCAVMMQLGVVASVFFGVYVYGRFPERVAFPAILASVSVLLVITQLGDRKPDRLMRAANVLSVVAAAVTLASALVFVYRWSDLPKPKTPLFAELTSTQEDDAAVKLLTTTYFAPQLIALPAGFNPKSDVDLENAIILDWWQRSPGFERRLADLGLNPDLIASVIDGDARFVSSNPNFADWICIFVEQNVALDEVSGVANECGTTWVALRNGVD